MDGVEGDARFVDLGDWRSMATGAPVLAGCPVTFDCRVVNTTVAGTHTIVIGEIVDVSLDSANMPLLYAEGAFMPGDLLKAAP
jgi:flavin reductase (DIM6/NTAB) family NADH-FMN oxidoreductase RutF